MKTKSHSRWLTAAVYRPLRWLLGSVFLYSGATKLIAPQPFAVLIDAYGLVPDGLLMPVALVLPALELVAGAGLLADIRGSLGAITGMLMLFIAILGYGIGMGLDVDCGCFGPEDPEAEAFHGLRTALYRDLFMLAAAGFLYAWRRYKNVKPRTLKELVQGQFTKTWTTPIIRKEEI
jgi:uncharacterized membrane protein YphA (DoxX/SURF4 family)